MTVRRRDRLRVYLAAPLFSEAELRFNHELKKILGEFCSVYLPQEDGLLLSEEVHAGRNPSEVMQEIFSADLKAIDDSHCILCSLDGRAIDEGVAFELGYAFRSNKWCIGLQTDPRRLLPCGNNPMIACSLTQIVHDIDTLVAVLQQASVTDQHEVKVEQPG